MNTYAYAWTLPARIVVRRLGELGCHSFELLVHPPHSPLDGFDAGSRRTLAAGLDAAGGTYCALNLPSLDHNLASPMPRARAAAVQMFCETIDLAADLRVDWLVLVQGRNSALAQPSRQQRQDWLRQYVDALLPLADARGVRFAVENGPIAGLPVAASLGAFVQEYASANLGVCYDVANAHLGSEVPAAGIAHLAGLLRIVHLSDTTRATWRHDPVGAGNVPFATVPAALAATGFQGPCMPGVLDDDAEAAILRSHAALATMCFAPRGSEVAA